MAFLFLTRHLRRDNPVREKACYKAEIMEDEKEKTADTTADQNSTDEKKETSTEAEGQSQEIDYDKELKEQVERFEQKEHNEAGYQKRKAKKDESEESGETNDIEAQVAKAIAKELPKVVSKLQSTVAEDSIETLLNEFAEGNEAKKKLLRWNFENRVMPEGTLRERMENATLITDKKAILKKQNEMATALKNRQGLGASGLGSSTEGQTVSDNILSTDQKQDLKARGWDDKKIERFKANLRR